MPSRDGNKRGNGEWRNIRPPPAAPGDPVAALTDSEGLLRCLDVCLRCGAYVAFQLSSDGGAVGITVLDGTYRARTWCHDSGDFRDALGALYEYLAGGTATADGWETIQEQRRYGRGGAGQR